MNALIYDEVRRSANTETFAELMKEKGQGP